MNIAPKQPESRHPTSVGEAFRALRVLPNNLDSKWLEWLTHLKLKFPITARLKSKFVGRETGLFRKRHRPTTTGLSAVKGLRVLVIGRYDHSVFRELKSANANVTWWHLTGARVDAFGGGEAPAAEATLNLDCPWDFLKQKNAPQFDLVYLHDCLHLSGNPAALLRFLRPLAPDCWIDALCSASPAANPDKIDRPEIVAVGAGSDTGKDGFDASWVENQLRLLNFSVLQKTSPFSTSPNSVRSPASPSARRYFYVGERMDQGWNLAPLLVHVHLPKNGGSSLKNMLRESFGPGHVEMYTEDPAEWKSGIDLLEVTYWHPDVQVVSSHSFRTYPHMIGARVPLYFCFLRDPIERHLSYYRYLRKDWDVIPPIQKAGLPPNFMDMSMPEFFAWQAELDRKHGETPNRQVRYFAKSDNLARAKSVLSQFFFVGTTDQINRGVQLLNEQLSAYGMSLDTSKIRHDNATGDQYLHTQECLSDPRVKQYLKGVTSDLKLYNWAKCRFEEECKKFGI